MMSYAKISTLTNDQENMKPDNEIGESPLISIITPTFNDGNLLENAIQSVLDQGYDRFEHIIIDRSVDKATVGLKDKYPHLKWIAEKDISNEDAMNRGFEASNGEIIAYLNASDYFLSDTFSTALPYFKKGAKFVLGKIKVMLNDGSYFFNNPGNTYHEWLEHWKASSFPVSPVGYLYLREVQEKIGGFKKSNGHSTNLQFLLNASNEFSVKKINKTFGVCKSFKEAAKDGLYFQELNWNKENFKMIDKQHLEKLPIKMLHEHQRMRNVVSHKNEFFKSPYGNEITEGVSLITSVKNREDNLEKSLKSWLACKEIDEIIIVDWDSDKPINELVDRYQDGRIFLYRAENKPKWMPSHARNIAAALTTKDKILKMDADALLFSNFFERHHLQYRTFYHSNWRIAENENETHLCGNFYSYREDFFKVNGFNEYIKAYGWEDSDLYIRMVKKGFKMLDLDHSTLYHMPHEQRHLHQSNSLNTYETALSFLKINIHKYLTENGYDWGLDEKMMDYDVEVIDGHYALLKQKDDHDRHIVDPADFEEAEKNSLQMLLANDKLGTGVSMYELRELKIDELKRLYRYYHGGLVERKQPVASKTFDLFLVPGNLHVWTNIVGFLDSINHSSKNGFISNIYIFYPKKYFNTHFKKILERNDVTLVETENWEYKHLFMYANKLDGAKEKNIILANAGLCFDHSLEKLLNQDLKNKCVFLSEWANVGETLLPKKITNGHDFLDKDALVFNAATKIDFGDAINYAVSKINFHRLYNYLFVKTEYKVFDVSDDIGAYYIRENQGENTEDKNHEEHRYPLKGIVRGGLDHFKKETDAQFFLTKRCLLIEAINENDSLYLESVLKLAENTNRNIWVYNPNNLPSINQTINSLNTNINIVDTLDLWPQCVTYKGNKPFHKFFEKNEEENIFVENKGLSAIAKQYSLITFLPKERYKISIVTPTYNAEEYIEDAIKSVLAQGITDFEHIVVDGGSTDGTVDILKKYPHLIWVSEPDEGQSDAMNKGFKMSSGNVIAYLNADDYFLPRTFEAVLPYFESGSKFVVGRVTTLFGDGSVWLNNPGNSFYSWFAQWGEQSFPVNPVGYFYRREIQETIGGYTNDNHLTMDLEFLLNASYLFSVTKINRALGAFRHFRGTKTINSYHNEEHWSTETFGYTEKFIDKMPPLLAMEYVKKRNSFYENKNNVAKAIHDAATLDEMDKLSPWELIYKVRTSIKHLCGDIDPIFSEEGIIAMAVVYNENFYVKEFVEHHLSIGVTKIILLDNGNNSDELVKILKPYEDKVSAFHSNLPSNRYKHIFKNYLTNRFGIGNWVILSEIDEFFDFPFSDQISLKDFIDYMEEKKFTAALTHQIDMLPPNDFATKPPFYFNEGLSKKYCYANIENIKKQPITESILSTNKVSNHQTKFLNGGIYKTLFDCDYNLSKINFFLNNGTLEMKSGNIRETNLADTGAFVRKYRFHRYIHTALSEDEFRFYQAPNFDIDIQNGLDSVKKIDLMGNNPIHADELNRHLCSNSFITTSLSFIQFVQQTFLLKNKNEELSTLVELQMIEKSQLEKNFQWVSTRLKSVEHKINHSINPDNPSQKVLTANKVKSDSNKSLETHNWQVEQTAKEKDELINKMYQSYSWKIGNGVMKIIAVLFGWIPFVKKRM